jgi:hypothetical protein
MKKEPVPIEPRRVSPGTRAKILAATGHVCARPGCPDKATDVDHILPLWLGGSNREKNLEGLCPAHHSAKTKAEATLRAKAKRLEKARLWSLEEDRIIRDYAQDGAEAIGTMLGRSACAVACRASRINVPLGKSDDRNSVCLPENFEKRVAMDPNSGCWLWTGTKGTNGYGVGYNVRQGRKDGERTTAHRMSYIIYNGNIPSGMMVCHRCDTPICVNPEHLFLGTAADNTRDKIAKGRANVLSGTDAPWSKLTPAQVEAILSDTRRLWVIAADYGVSISTISRVQLGQSYTRENGTRRERKPIPSRAGGWPKGRKISSRNGFTP